MQYRKLSELKKLEKNPRIITKEGQIYTYMRLVDHIKDVDIDFAFDMICMHNFVSGDLGRQMTVEENREAFEYLKKQILLSPENNRE